MTPDRPDQARARAYKRIIWTIALGIAVLAGAQAAWALSIGSRQLLKDASDWIYDVVLYGIAAFTFGRGAAAERGSALVIAAIMAAGGLHTLYDLWDKVVAPRPIEIATIGFSAASAIAVGYAVLWALLRFRHDGNPLVQATWLTARNDAVATTLFALVAFATRIAPMRWPEYALDLVGAALSFQATFAIVRARLRDRRSAGAAGLP
jgi:Co/Zn/Cd efflux system component